MFELPKVNVKDKVSAQEWQIRVDLAACYRLMVMHGWDDLIHTHISARIPGYRASIDQCFWFSI